MRRLAMGCIGLSPRSRSHPPTLRDFSPSRPACQDRPFRKDVRFTQAHPPAIVFHPADPSIPLQSISWETPISQGSDGVYDGPSKLARFPFRAGRWNGASDATCDGWRAYRGGRRRRWRDAVFEGPFRHRLVRTEFAEPSQDRPCRLPIAGAGRRPSTSSIILRSQVATGLRFDPSLKRGFKLSE